MNDSQGFTLIELLVAVAIIGLASAMAIPVYHQALENSHESALKADCYQLYYAMMRYQFDYDKFPSETDFDLETLAPLSEEGYFNAASTFIGKLRDETMLIYLAPDVDGTDTQFVMISQSDLNPAAIYVVAYTNVIEDTDGWIDGVYLIDDDELEEASDDLGGGDGPPAVPAS